MRLERSNVVKLHDLTDRFFAMEVPLSIHPLDRDLFCMDQPSETRGFLMARRETVGDDVRWRVYPRAILLRGWHKTLRHSLRSDTCARLAPAWEAAFDALPAWSITPEDMVGGKPTLAGTIPARKAYPQDDKDAHPYWRCVVLALQAALSMARIPLPPPPPNSYRSTFHWTVFAQRVEAPIPEKGTLDLLPLRVQIPYLSAWCLLHETTVVAPSFHAHLQDVQTIASILGKVYTAMAPDLPLFFDTLEFDERVSGERIGFSSCSTGQFFPWMREEQALAIGTAHHAMEALSQLPPAWSAALIEAMQAYTPAGA